MRRARWVKQKYEGRAEELREHYHHKYGQAPPNRFKNNRLWLEKQVLQAPSNGGGC